MSVFVKTFQLKHTRGSHIRAHTIGNEGSARQHFAEHELDDGQDDADQSADDRHAEQEAILRGVQTTAQGEQVETSVSGFVLLITITEEHFICVKRAKMSCGSG